MSDKIQYKREINYIENMDRKHFLKSALLTTGSLLLGGTAIYRHLNSKETADAPLPQAIDKIQDGNMKKVLVQEQSAVIRTD